MPIWMPPTRPIFRELSIKTSGSLGSPRRYLQSNPDHIVFRQTESTHAGRDFVHDTLGMVGLGLLFSQALHFVRHSVHEVGRELDATLCQQIRPLLERMLDDVVPALLP